MKRPIAVLAFAAILVSLSGGIAHAKGPKRPDRPFTLHVFTKSIEKDVQDSTRDVRTAIQEKKQAWFLLTEKPEEAELVLEIQRRDWSSDHNYIVHGELAAFDDFRGEIIGQFLVSAAPIWKVGAGSWRTAAQDMANRLERYCRDTYPHLTEARSKRGGVAAAGKP
jgi:hypothetical protein